MNKSHSAIALSIALLLSSSSMLCAQQPDDAAPPIDTSKQPEPKPVDPTLADPFSDEEQVANTPPVETNKQPQPTPVDPTPADPFSGEEQAAPAPPNPFQSGLPRSPQNQSSFQTKSTPPTKIAVPFDAKPTPPKMTDMPFEAKPGLPQLSEMPLPDADDLLTGDPVDWVVLRDGHVVVTQPIHPRPDTLRKIAEEKTAILNAKGGTVAQRAEQNKRLEELRYVHLKFPEDSRAEYKVAVDKIEKIISFEQLKIMAASKLWADGDIATATKLLQTLQPTSSPQIDIIGDVPLQNRGFSTVTAEDGGYLIQTELTKARLEEQELSQNLGPRHPVLVQLQKRIKALEDMLQKRPVVTNSVEPSGIADTKDNLRRQRILELNASKRDWEKELADAEASAARTAQKYRTETHDPAAAAQLKQLLEADVRRAFEAQSMLQTERLQIAELQLQDVRLKQQRRCGMANRIIERRVEELLSGADLSWPIHDAASNSPSVQPPNVVNRTDQNAASPDPAQLPATIAERTHQVRILVQPSYAKMFPLTAGDMATLTVHLSAPQHVQAIGIATPVEIDAVRIVRDRAEYILLVTPEQAENITAAHRISPFWFALAPYKDGHDAIFANAERLSDFMHDHPEYVPHQRVNWVYGGTSDPPRIESLQGFGIATHRDASPQARSANDPAMAADLPPQPEFDDPQALLDHLLACGKRSDYDGYVAQLTDDETDRFAGMLMMSAAVTSVSMGIMEANAHGVADSDLAAMKNMQSVFQKSMRSDPPADALAAYTLITQSAFAALGGSGATNASLSDFPETLRLSAGVLKDSRRFVVDMLHVMDSFGGGSPTPHSADANWKITTDGDQAVASSDEGSELGTIELKRINGKWKVSRLLGDDTFQQLAAGPPASKPDSLPPPPHTIGNAAPQVATSQVKGSVLVPIVVARIPISKGDLLTPNSLSVSARELPVGSDPNGVVTSHADALWKYATTDIPPGALISKDNVKPTPTLTELIQARLDDPSCLPSLLTSRAVSPERQTPFSGSGKSVRPSLPPWVADYVSELNKVLAATPPADWTAPVVSLTGTIDHLLWAWRESDDWDLATTGKLLTGLAKNQAHSKDPAINAALISAPFLSRIARTTGKLPREVMSVAPLSESTLAKLDLLTTMLNNGGAYQWISQEQVRLAGLFEEAPVQTIQALVTIDCVRNHSNMEHFVFAVSSNEAYRSFRSSPKEPYGPPVDPVLLVTILDSLAGQSEANDDRIVHFFREDHPAYMLKRHLDDILSGTLACRTTVHASLVGIYRKSKTKQLRDAIADLAPSVAVAAKALDDDVVVLRGDSGRPVDVSHSVAISRDAESILEVLNQADHVVVATPLRNHLLMLHEGMNCADLADAIQKIVRQYPQTAVYKYADPEAAGTPRPLQLWLHVPGAATAATVAKSVIGQIKRLSADLFPEVSPPIAVPSDFLPVPPDIAAIEAVLKKNGAVMIGQPYVREQDHSGWNGISIVSETNHRAVAVAIAKIYTGRVLYQAEDNLQMITGPAEVDLMTEDLLEAIVVSGPRNP